MTTDEALALARQYKKILIESEIPIMSVFLFGSSARGDAKKQSDVDIAIVARAFRPSLQEESLLLRKLRRPLSRRIETVCLHPEDMENKYFTLAQEVKREGILV